MKDGMDRRTFLRLSGLSAAAAVAAACGAPGGDAEPQAADEAPAAEAPAADSGSMSKYNESPLLAENCDKAAAILRQG